MSDTKLADLTALTTPSGDDLLYVVDDPAGTPSDKKLALDNLFTRGTVTVSSPVIDAAQTWNAGGVTFTGLKFNATDTASAAASLLMDLQVGGASAFNVSKAGSLKLGINSSGTNVAGTNVVVAGSQGTGNAAGGSIIFQVAPAGLAGTNVNALFNALTISNGPSAGRTLLTVPTFSAMEIGVNGAFAFLAGGNDAFSFTYGLANFITVRSTGGFGWSNSGTNASLTADLILARDTSNTLAQRNGNEGQTFRLYGRFTDITNNFERFFINAPTTAGAAVLLGTQKGATAGTARALELQTDGTTRLTIAATTGNVTTTGSVTTEAPTGGTAAAWRLGTVASVTPTLQNRTIEVDIGGTIYYISAKTTND
jgi:hypothetical protein